MGVTRTRGSVAPPTEARPSWLARVSVSGGPYQRQRLNKCFDNESAAREWVRSRVGPERARVKQVARAKGQQHVYVISDPFRRRVKIGIAACVPSRLRHLQCANPDLVLEGYLDKRVIADTLGVTSTWVEASLHARLAPWALAAGRRDMPREWFHLEGDVDPAVHVVCVGDLSHCDDADRRQWAAAFRAFLAEPALGYQAEAA